jgi:hypothetical protein
MNGNKKPAGQKFFSSTKKPPSLFSNPQASLVPFPPKTSENSPFKKEAKVEDPSEISEVEIPPGLNYYMDGLIKVLQSDYDAAEDLESQIYREHFLQTFQALHFCTKLKPTDPNVLASKRQPLIKRTKDESINLSLFDFKHPGRNRQTNPCFRFGRNSDPL